MIHICEKCDGEFEDQKAYINHLGSRMTYDAEPLCRCGGVMQPHQSRDETVAAAYVAGQQSVRDELEHALHSGLIQGRAQAFEECERIATQALNKTRLIGVHEIIIAIRAAKDNGSSITGILPCMRWLKGVLYMITPIICAMCEFDWKNGACGNCQMSRAQLDAVSALQSELDTLRAERDRIYTAFCGRDGMHLPLFEALEERFKALWAAEAKLSRYETALKTAIALWQQRV